MADREIRRFETPDGLTLVGEVAGPVEAPGVILLHGGGQTRHSWAGTMDRLIGRGYRVVSYDARGHGDSDWSRDGAYSIAAMAADLCAVRQTLTGPAAFVGASMGGLTSFYAAGTSDPLPAQALVLVDIVLRASETGMERVRDFMTRHRDGFASLEAAVEAVTVYNPMRPRDPSGLRKNLREREDGRLYWHWDPRMLDTSPRSEPSPLDEIVACASQVTVPTLVVRGEHSDIVDEEGIAQMLRLVPQTEVHTVTGAGHMVAGDRNDAFSDGVLSFLAHHFPA